MPENESTPIQYKMPDSDAYMDSSQAEGKLKELQSDAIGDVNHPYTNGNHPLHRDFVEYSHHLHEIAAEGKEGIFEKAYREGQEMMAKRQEKVVAEAEMLVNELVSLGFDRIDVEPDTPAWKLDIWRMQGQCAKGDYLQLASAIESESRKMQTSQDAAPLLRILRDSDSSDELRTEIAERLVEGIYKAKMQKETK